MKRVKLSGAQNKKKKKSNEQQASVLKNSLLRFGFKRNSNDGENNQGSTRNQSSSTLSTTANPDQITDSRSVLTEESYLEQDSDSSAGFSDAETEFSVVDQCIELNSELTNKISTERIWKDEFADPGSWPSNLNGKVRTLIFHVGPVQLQNFRFPKNQNGRGFTNKHYSSIQCNGESVRREWLVYSKLKDSVFCYPCKLFLPGLISLTNDEGCRDWQHLSSILKEHEVSKNHKRNVISWGDFMKRSESGKTFEDYSIKKIEEEVNYWTSIFERLFAITNYLAQRSLSFRGSADTLFTPQNGNFLGLVELLSKFDPVMKEHVENAVSKELDNHYLSKTIQNEIIDIISASITKQILLWRVEAKYFSILVDCTRDVSRTEQMTLVIRFVKEHMKEVKVEEHFLGFTEAISTTGEALTANILDTLNKFKLPILDCRGQGYDSGSNMSGVNLGVQKRILDVNPRAFFVPCAVHRLNSVLLDSAKSCAPAITFFGTIQALYTFFAASSQRWSVLKKIVPDFTLKPLAETRWAARFESVKAVRFQISEISDALVDLSNSLTDPDAKFQSLNLGKSIQNYSFIMSTCIWYEILFRVNLVSIGLQSSNLELDSAIVQIDKLEEFFLQFNQTGFDEAKRSANEISKELDIPAVFEESIKLRNRKKKPFFGDSTAVQIELKPEEKFRLEFFEKIVQVSRSSLKERFDQIKSHNTIFGFLYKVQELKNESTKNIQDKCLKLEERLKFDGKSDINGNALAEELRKLANLLPSNSGALESLKFIVTNEYKTVFPQACTALKILLTIPVTVASGERSFSRLKLIKTYLSSTMGQERLSDLAIIAIERDVGAQIELKSLIKEFTERKARKIILT